MNNGITLNSCLHMYATFINKYKQTNKSLTIPRLLQNRTGNHQLFHNISLIQLKTLDSGRQDKLFNLYPPVSSNSAFAEDLEEDIRVDSVARKCETSVPAQRQIVRNRCTALCRHPDPLLCKFIRRIKRFDLTMTR